MPCSAPALASPETSLGPLRGERDTLPVDSPTPRNTPGGGPRVSFGQEPSANLAQEADVPGPPPARPPVHDGQGTHHPAVRGDDRSRTGSIPAAADLDHREASALGDGCQILLKRLKQRGRVHACQGLSPAVTRISCSLPARRTRAASGWPMRSPPSAAMRSSIWRMGAPSRPTSVSPSGPDTARRATERPAAGPAGLGRHATGPRVRRLHGRDDGPGGAGGLDRGLCPAIRAVGDLRR